VADSGVSKFCAEAPSKTSAGMNFEMDQLREVAFCYGAVRLAA
jgi:hypothetical protein